MTIKDNILYNSPCYRTGRKITVKGLMLHSVGCAQPSAPVFCRMFANYTQAAVHAFIDANTGVIYQTLPWNHRAWHCGASANNTHIGVEMCESAYIRYTSGTSLYTTNRAKAQADCKRAYNSAVQLFAYLCKKYSLDPMKSGVIVSHREGHLRGIASNHGDPEHYWRGCGMSYTMDGFRRDVRSAMTGSSPSSSPSASSNIIYRIRRSWKDVKSQIGAYIDLEAAKKACKEGYSIFDKDGKAVYTKKAKNEENAPVKVRIKVSELNIRQTPGLDGEITGTIAPGTYTITQQEEADGITWGRLKSGAGWISMAYTEVI